MYTTLLFTRFQFLRHAQSAHDNGESVPTTVAFMDLSDLHCVIHQVIVDDNMSGVS